MLLLISTIHSGVDSFRLAVILLKHKNDLISALTEALG